MTKQHKETRYIPARELRTATNPDGSRTLSGYAAVFDSLSVDMGGWKETINPGCFTRALKSNPDVVCLRDHDNAILLGRTRSRTLTLEQDSTGLKFECVLPKTSQAADLTALVERGDIDGCSFSFVANVDDWQTTADGLMLRTLIDVDLFDVSVVSEPAYPDTSVSLRNAPMEIRATIESRKPAKRDDNPDLEADGTPDDTTDCNCECDPCTDGDCDRCTDLDCSLDCCSCARSEERFRHWAKAVLTLAQYRGQLRRVS